jgi:NAD(P)H-quinone oxidoreductase subunit 5
MSGSAMLALAACLSPLVSSGIGPRPAARTAISTAGLVTAIVLLVDVARSGPVVVFDGWIVVDRVAAVWLVFALAMVLMVRSFAQRQLAADGVRERFDRLSALTAATGALLFCAGNLVALAIAAVASSVAASALVGVGTRQPMVGRRMASTLLLGDAALVAAVVTVAVAADTTGFAALADADGAVLHLAALAVVMAALARCAQLPFHRWLPRSIEAPTPASALLHAGVVNAGGVLLVRTAPLVARSGLAVAVGLALAVASMVVGAAAMRGRVEVKTSLVWSTTAQMGFMIVQVLLGLGAAAAAHLVAHGAYKANLFLSSGSTLEHRPAPSPRRVPSAAVSVRAVAIGALVVGAATAISGYDIGAHDGAAVLVPIFAVATVHAVLTGPAGLGSGSARRSSIVIGALAAATVVYLALLSRFERWLSLPDATPSGAFASTLVVVAAVLAGAAIMSPSLDPRRPVVAALRARVIAATRRPVVDLGAIAHRGAS